jgi:hypothetical protein
LDKNDLFNSCDYVAFTTGASPQGSTSQKGAASYSILVPPGAFGAANATGPTMLPVVHKMDLETPPLAATSDNLHGKVVSSVFAHHQTNDGSAKLTLAHVDAVFVKGFLHTEFE